MCRPSFLGQGIIHRVNIEFLRLEIPSRPSDVLLMILMSRVEHDFQELFRILTLRRHPRVGRDARLQCTLALWVAPLQAGSPRE